MRRQCQLLLAEWALDAKLDITLHVDGTISYGNTRTDDPERAASDLKYERRSMGHGIKA